MPQTATDAATTVRTFSPDVHYRVSDVSLKLSMDIRQIDSAIESGALKSQTIGKSIFVRGSEVSAWLNRAPATLTATPAKPPAKISATAPARPTAAPAKSVATPSPSTPATTKKSPVTTSATATLPVFPQSTRNIPMNAIAEWTRRLDEKRASGMSNAQAVKALVREAPELYKQYIEQHNATHPHVTRR